MDLITEKVTHIQHWNDSLFSFKTTRPPSLRFLSGEFIMVGLMGDADDAGKAKPIMRAYSIASPAWDDELEFYSIKVPNGPLTSKLQHLKVGDDILLKTKPVGTLLLDALEPKGRLWLFATGTGIAPFASLLRDPDTYQRYDQVILTHTCRDVSDLDYGKSLLKTIQEDELIHELIGKEELNKLVYYPNTTREQSGKMGRITDLLRDGTAQADLDVPQLTAATDRGMICGSKAFNLEMKEILESFGLEEGNRSEPKQFVIEKAFAG